MGAGFEGPLELTASGMRMAKEVGPAAMATLVGHRRAQGSVWKGRTRGGPTQRSGIRSGRERTVGHRGSSGQRVALIFRVCSPDDGTERWTSKWYRSPPAVHCRSAAPLMARPSGPSTTASSAVAPGHDRRRACGENGGTGDGRSVG